MNEARMCQLRALLDEKLGKVPRVRPRLVEADRAPKRKPQRATAEASVTEATLHEETSMKKMNQTTDKVKPADAPGLFGVRLSDLTEGEISDIRVIILGAMLRLRYGEPGTVQDRKIVRGFRVIEGGRA